MATASTKTEPAVVTYAQNVCCGAVRMRLQAFARYQTSSAAKSLIHIAFLNCFFYRQSSQSLDLQGLPANVGNLSTKLSTEKVSFCKAHVNQALSAFFACIGQDMSTIAHTFQPAA
jgi:hypothetical protein